MIIRNALLATTMLSGVLGFTVIGAMTAQAADPTSPPAAPAVAGLNEKAEAFGGSLAQKPLYGVDGSIAFPVQGNIGAQLDGGLGALDGYLYGGAGGHLFWRDPNFALLGAYASTTVYNRFGGVDATHIGPEAAYYMGPLTLEGTTGIEFGNKASGPSGTVSTPQAGTIPAMTTSVTSPGYNVKTRFYDEVNLKGYINSDWSATIGHRYLGGENALALGTEYALSLGNGLMGSLFAAGNIGGRNVQGVWGGLKIYFGPSDKTLTARERQDDPPNWTTDTLAGITGNHTGSSNTGTQISCTDPDTVLDGDSCRFLVSDIALKRDIILMAWLAAGFGLYRYRYRWSNTVYVGVMAQEVAQVVPEAVIRAADGYLRVNYERLGLRLMTWDEWMHAHDARDTVAA